MTPTARTDPQPVKSACNAMLDVRQPSHDEVIGLVFACRSVVGRTGSLSPSCQKAVMDQLKNVVEWIVDDQIAQGSEQKWRDDETRRLAA